MDSSGQREDTVVFFASDNGGERFSYVWPFTGDKGSLKEGGIRVPTILSWPGTLPAGQVSDVPVITMDWTATLLDLGGADRTRSTRWTAAAWPATCWTVRRTGSATCSGGCRTRVHSGEVA